MNLSPLYVSQVSTLTTLCLLFGPVSIRWAIVCLMNIKDSVNAYEVEHELRGHCWASSGVQLPNGRQWDSGDGQTSDNGLFDMFPCSC